MADALKSTAAHMSVGALGDSFYEYLLKSWLGTSKADTEARDMYYAAIDVSVLGFGLGSVWKEHTCALYIYIYIFGCWCGQFQRKLFTHWYLQAILNKLVRKSSHGLTMLVDLRNGMMDGKMQHLVGLLDLCCPTLHCNLFFFFFFTTTILYFSFKGLLRWWHVGIGWCTCHQRQWGKILGGGERGYSYLPWVLPGHWLV